MSGFQRRLVRGLCGCLLAASAADGKTVMGIVNGQDFQLVSTFCFTFPPKVPGVPVPNGRIHSQTIVSSNGHNFLVLNNSELEKGLPCQELVKQAKVIEPLGEKTQKVIAYDLTLNVEPSMDRQCMAAVIARCGQTVNAEYIVEFTNPGDSGWEQHFACTDQGLLQTYLWFSAMAVVLGGFAFKAQRVLHQRQAHNDVSALFFAGTAFFVARIFLFTIHLLVYSRNGMGLGMLLFAAQYLDFLSNTMGMLVLMSMVHGVYVTRPCVPPGSMERNVLLQVVGAFAATYLVSTLACGFKVDVMLSPFGVLRGLFSWPYLATRAWTGVFCFNRGVKLATSSEGQGKKNSILRFTFLAAGWLVLPSVMVVFSGPNSWNGCAFLMDLANFCMFGVVLHDLWPSRFGTLFSIAKPTERAHPYSEFGLPG